MNAPVKQASDALCQALFDTREYWLTGDDFVLSYQKLAETTIAALRSLPVEQRMEAMGMIPVHIDRDGEPYYDGAALPASVLDDLWTVLND